MRASRHLELFEHETLRVGERGFSEAHFAAVARFNDRNQRRYFSIGHRSITATHHVGYVEVGGLGIEILPKAAGRRDATRWQAALIEMLNVATGLKLAAPSPASQETDRSSLLELIAARFVVEVERLLHEGLARGYNPHEENGPAFRGRLLVAPHLRENLVRADRFYVAHTTYDHDVTVNCLLTRALEELLASTLSASLRQRVGACASQFPETTDTRLTAELFARVRLTRATARYEHALVLARMLLEHRTPQLRHGAAHVFAILFDMNSLWECYVAWLFRRAVSAGTTVITQQSRPFWQVPGQQARTIRPDLLVRSRGRAAIVADAKWKVPGSRPEIPDLRQMFVYNELLGVDRAILVYPGGEGATSVTGRYAAARGHTCETLFIELFHDGCWNPKGPRMGKSSGQRVGGRGLMT